MKDGADEENSDHSTVLRPSRQMRMTSLDQESVSASGKEVPEQAKKTARKSRKRDTSYLSPFQRLN